MAYIVTAYIVMAHIVMAHIVMAYIADAGQAQRRVGGGMALYKYGPI